METGSYRELIVWQRGVDLTVECYQITRGFPREEMFGLVSQVRRAASSVPANIAEGHGRESKKELLHFLSIARGSLKELETHLIVSHRVGYIPADSLRRVLAASEEVSRLLFGFRRYVLTLS